MSGEVQTKDVAFVIEAGTSKFVQKETLVGGQPEVNMAETQVPKLSPASTKSRSLPSTPSQRPGSPPGRRVSPHALRTERAGSPHSLRSTVGRNSPVYKRGMVCKYETGMKQARRRVPYTLGPEKLEADPIGAAKRLSPKEEFRLRQDMTRLYERLLPTQESESRRQALVQKLEALFGDRWPGQRITVNVFGSTGNLLGTAGSDVDICISTDCKDIEHVCSIADLLARNGMERVVCVSSAKVPIVKVWDPELQVACDMNVNNPIALENTALIRSYIAIDDRFRPLAMIVKYWAKRRVLNDAALGGTLSSYTWICLVLNFLQTRQPPILPSLQASPNLEPRLLNGINVAFDKDLSKYHDFGKANTSSLGDLLFQFFHYYSHELDLEKSVVSVRLGKVIPKSQKAWHLLQDNRLCVEEPFNISRNLGNTADDTSVRGIHLELRRACDMIASGNLEKCCEQYEQPQTEIPPRRAETFVQPTTKAIIPQPPPQPQQHLPRQSRSNHVKSKRGDRQANAGRRASNPPNRTNTHLRDLPFPMTPQELHAQQQHQQHLLHDQLFQQYQYLQMQEQELRLQLHRHRGLVATGGLSNSGLASSDAGEEGDTGLLSARTNVSSRMPLTAPLYQARFNPVPASMNNGVMTSGIVTNPASPLLATAIPDSRRYARRASINNAAASSLRAQSQPARGLSSTGLPYMTQRFEVPVRQVDLAASRRSSAASMMQDPMTGLLPQQLMSLGTRYDAGRPAVEYVGYYVGQSPSLSAHLSSATVSPLPSAAGLAIHHGGLSPRISTRSSRLPSVSTSPTSHYASLASGAKVLTPVTENISSLHSVEVNASPSQRGPLVVDGSINSPPRRQNMARPARSSSEEFDISVTTSEDAALDTPSSSDDASNNGSRRSTVANDGRAKHLNGELLHEQDFLSLNGTSTRFQDPLTYDDSDPAAVLGTVVEERNIRQLTNALTAATINNGVLSNGIKRHQHAAPAGTPDHPLTPFANGSQPLMVSPSSLSQEWQTQKTKRKHNKKKGQRIEEHDRLAVQAGAEIPPADESLRKGG
ncbi:hypothetical protein LTS08_007356 [Lithohypha guttulata]|nr:hypothetical protein LTS08_007356 [Lithohypha guttulata]